MRRASSSPPASGGDGQWQLRWSAVSRRLPAAALIGSVVLLLVDLGLAPIFAYRVPQPDFYVYYLAALLGRTRGWAVMYDPLVFQPAVTAVVGRYLPYLNPPLLAWVVTPLSWLPYDVAARLWTSVLAASLLAAWFIAAPARRVWRLVHLLAAAATLPVFVSFLFGEVSLVIVAAVAAAWWLLDRGRPWAAGLVLATLSLKPQIAFLVPIALLIAGHWRVFLSWLGATTVVVAMSLLAVGTQAIDHIRQSLVLAAGVPGPIQVSLLRQAPSVVIAVSAIIVVAGLFLFASWRATEQRPAFAIAIGLLTSVLVTPYLNFYDLAALVLAAWLIWRTDPPTWQRVILVALYVPIYLAPVWPVATVISECGWLVSLAVLGTLKTRESGATGAERQAA
jgi:Glycosyltransferase family 87